jgi:NAD(P)-dependent dehydrogenase (short-subunit alcohol dehydrogenase family)
MTTELNGKIALVTGGGRGLGEQICNVLGEAGMTVVAADIRQELVERVAGKLRQAGHEAMGLCLDVTDEAQVNETIRQIVAKYGRLDAVVNSAGTDKTIPVEELDVADFDRVLDVNLRAPFVMAKAAVPFMREQGGGHIVNIVSTGALRAWPNAAAYNASKWGLRGLSQALHSELRPYGMRTPFLLDRFPDIDVNNLQDPKNVAEVVRYVLTQPEETVIPEVMVLPMRETSWP